MFRNLASRVALRASNSTLHFSRATYSSSCRLMMPVNTVAVPTMGGKVKCGDGLKFGFDSHEWDHNVREHTVLYVKAVN